MDRGELKNPFAGYEAKILTAKKKVSPVHEIVDVYHQLKNTDKMPKNFYKGRNSYMKLAREAMQLYISCNSNLDDALWSLDKMKYKADKGNFDWSISTCLKHKLI